MLPALHARAFAWPWTDPGAFGGGLWELVEGTSATADLGRGLTDDLRLHLGDRSMAELDPLRRRAWYGQVPAERVRLVDLLLAEAGRLLRAEGGKVSLRGECSDQWIWARCMLPTHLWTAAAAVERGVPMTRWRVSLLSPPLERLLEEGLAETHQHLTDAGDFLDRWTWWMLRLAMEPPRPLALSLTDSPPFGSPRACIQALMVAAIARIRLAARVLGRAELPPSRSMQALERGRLNGLNPYQLQRELRALCGPISPHFGKSAETLYAADPLRPVARWGERPETSFLYLLLQKMRDDPDPALQKLGNQYLRIQILFFRYATQEPGTRGLAWFGRFSNRGKALRPPPNWTLQRGLLAVGPFRSVEVRTVPPLRRQDLRLGIQEMARCGLRLAKEERPRELAMVLHFVKRTAPGKRPEKFRHGRWYRDALGQARVIESTFQLVPESLYLLRGLDLAGAAELAMPLWPVVPLLRRLRCYSEKVSALLERERPDRLVPGLRITLHAGEDYRHPVEGLRRIHESLESGLYRSGDRIGHGLALARDGSGELLPAEDYLDDLLWEWERYQRGELLPAAGRGQRLERELRELGEQIYGEAGVEELARARRLRWIPEALARVGWLTGRTDRERYGDGPKEEGAGAEARLLLMRYLRDPQVRRRGLRTVTVSADQRDPVFVAQARSWVRRELGRMEVTIETNPSSNHLIARMRNVREHPIFSLAPLNAPADDGLTVSVNTDGPSTFNTSLPEEYGLLYHAMLQSGIAAADALQWIERVRRDGMRSRFSLQASQHQDLLRRLAFGTK